MLSYLFREKKYTTYCTYILYSAVQKWAKNEKDSKIDYDDFKGKQYDIIFLIALFSYFSLHPILREISQKIYLQFILQHALMAAVMAKIQSVI